MTHETRVKRAAQRRASAMQEYRDAIKAAADAGLSTREIAKHAGVSQVAVVKMLNR